MATTPNFNLPLIDESMTANVPRDMDALAQAVDANVKTAIDNVTVPDASTTQKGIVQLSSATNSTAEDRAATPKAVKAAYDLANTANTAAGNAQSTANAAKATADAALPKTGGTINGALTVVGNGGSNLDLVGDDHVYMEFYPQGIAGGRQSYIGYPNAGSKNLELVVTNTTGQIVFYDNIAGTMTLNDIKEGINQAKQSGVDFKTKTAGAINSRGGSASASMTSDQMAAAITALTSRTAVVTNSFNSNNATQTDTLYETTYFTFPANTQRVAFMSNDGTSTYVRIEGTTSGLTNVGVRLYDNANNYVEINAINSGVGTQTNYLNGFVFDSTSRTVKVNGTTSTTKSLPSAFNTNGTMTLRGVYSFTNANGKGVISGNINGTLNYL